MKIGIEGCEYHILMLGGYGRCHFLFPRVCGYVKTVSGENRKRLDKVKTLHTDDDRVPLFSC
jgi:hypothetical protein